MDDRDILQRIGQLANDEHALYQQAEAGEGRARTRRLDCAAWKSCWTSAGTCCGSAAPVREFGQDPDAATLRSATTVERYEA